MHFHFQIVTNRSSTVRKPKKKFKIHFFASLDGGIKKLTKHGKLYLKLISSSSNIFLKLNGPDFGNCTDSGI